MLKKISVLLLAISIILISGLGFGGAKESYAYVKTKKIIIKKTRTVIISSGYNTPCGYDGCLNYGYYPVYPVQNYQPPSTYIQNVQNIQNIQNTQQSFSNYSYSNYSPSYSYVSQPSPQPTNNYPPSSYQGNYYYPSQSQGCGYSSCNGYGH